MPPIFLVGGTRGRIAMWRSWAPLAWIFGPRYNEGGESTAIYIWTAVGLEIELVEAQDFRKITRHFERNLWDIR